MSGRGGDYDVTRHISKLDDKSSVRYQKKELCTGFSIICWGSVSQWPGLCSLCPWPSGEEPFPNTSLSLTWHYCKPFTRVLSLSPESRAQCCPSTACEELLAAMMPSLTSSGWTNTGISPAPHSSCFPDPLPSLFPLFNSFMSLNKNVNESLLKLIELLTVQIDSKESK